MCIRDRIRTTDDIGSGCKQMQTKREIQNGCPNQASSDSGYELANKPKIKTKDVWWKRRVRKPWNNNNNKQTLSEKKEEAGNVSEQRDKGWINVIRVDTNHLAVTTTLLGSRRSRDYPPHSYIVNERYNPRNKRSWKRKNSQWQGPTQPQILT